jgi:hypothetical protein
MEAILNEFNKIDLYNQNILKNYKILPTDIKNNYSIQQIERILKCLNLLKENVQLVKNPRNKEYPIIKSADPINVCILCFFKL